MQRLYSSYTEINTNAKFKSDCKFIWKSGVKNAQN